MRRILPLALILAALPFSPCAADGDADDRAIRDLAGRFFDAYASKDADAFMALWSEKSPDYASAKLGIGRVIAETGRIEVKSLTVVWIRREGDAAQVHVRVELSGNDARTGKPHPAMGKHSWVFDVVRNAGQWKVTGYQPAARRLMALLEGADSRAARLRLLDDDSDLVGPAFVRMVGVEATARSGRGDFEGAARLHRLAREIADGLGDLGGLGDCFLYRGRSLADQGLQEQALADYEQGLALFRKGNDLDRQAVTLLAMGEACGALGRREDELRHFRDAVQAARDLGDRKRESYALWCAGRACFDLGRPAEALKQYQDGLAIARDLGDLEESARHLNSLGNVFQTTARYKEALAVFEEGLAIARRRGDRKQEAIVLGNIGNVCTFTGQYDEALKNFENELRIARDLGDRRNEADALGGTGAVYGSMGRCRDALGPLQDSLRIARETGASREEAFTLNSLAHVCRAMGRYEDARKYAQDSLTLFRDRKDGYGEAYALAALGDLYLAQGRYADALEQYQDALQKRRALGDRDGESATRSSLATAYVVMGRYTDALESGQEAATIARAIGDRLDEGAALMSMGDAYRAQGQFADALRSYEDALKLSREIGHRDNEASALGGVGAAYLRMGRYGEALRSYEDALRLTRETGWRPGESSMINNVGIVYMDAGLYAEARRCFQDSLALKRAMGDRPKELAALINLSQLCRSNANYTEALQYCRDALPIARELGDRSQEVLVLGNRGATYLALGRYAEALEDFQDGLGICRDLGDHAEEATLLDGMGEAFRGKGDYDAALGRLNDSIKIAESLGMTQAVSHGYYDIGRVHEARKQWREAADAYRQAADRIEQQRAGSREPGLQTGFLSHNTDTYFRLARCLLELGRPEEAFAVGERIKARALVDLLQQGKADPRRGMSDDERKQEQTLEDALTALGVQLEDLRSHKADVALQTTANEALVKARQDLEEFRRALYLRRPDLQSRRAEFAPASPEDLGRSLFHERPGLAVLSYLVGEDETLLFVLTAPDRDGGSCRLAVRRIDVSSKDLAEAVEQFREGCSDPGKGEPDSDDLYRWLLAPADAELKGARQVVIVPGGVLHTLPFQALKGPDDRYLIQRFAVSYAPSVTALTKMETLGETRREQYAGRAPSVLAVGVSDFGRREKKLPAAQEEAKAVAEAFGMGGKLLTGAEATRARLESSWSGRRYLHFATHGRLDADAPLYSSLVLTPDHDEGTLYANDLLDADVPAELVVMSACHSGEGRQVNGEGLKGMSWAWFGAGVPSVVASQWSVGDASTARLMKVFYARLAGGDSKAEALRQAETALLADPATRHPFYWAPFVLVGDDR